MFTTGRRQSWGRSIANHIMSSTHNTIVILMALSRPRQYHDAAEKLGMAVSTLDAEDVSIKIGGSNTFSALLKALHSGSLDCLKEVEKGRSILLDFCPISTIAVEGIYGMCVGELDAKDISDYKEEWREKWLPFLAEAGYSKIVVLADIEDIFIPANEQQKNANGEPVPVQLLTPKRKAGYMSAIMDYHAAMSTLSTGSQDRRQAILAVYGYQHACILVDAKDTPASALARALC